MKTTKEPMLEKPCPNCGKDLSPHIYCCNPQDHSIMHEAEKESKEKKRLEYLKKHWNNTNHEPTICPDCIEYLGIFPDGFDSDLEAQRQ